MDNKVLCIEGGDWFTPIQSWLFGYRQKKSHGPSENEICVVVKEEASSYYFEGYKGSYGKKYFVPLTDDEVNKIINARKNIHLSKLLNREQEDDSSNDDGNKNI